MTFVEFILFIIGMIILVVAGIFAALAAGQVNKIDGHETQSKLRTAKSWSIWSAVVAFIGVAMVMILLAIYIYQHTQGEHHRKNLSANGIFRFVIIVSAITATVAGLFAVISALDMHNTEDDDLAQSAKDNGGHRNAVIAAVLSFVAAGFFVAAFIIALFNKGDAVAKGFKGLPEKLGITKQSGTSESLLEAMRAAGIEPGDASSSESLLARAGQFVADNPELLEVAAV
jgi:MFS family permease